MRSLKVAATSIHVQTVCNSVAALDLYYIPSRYPNGLPSGFPHHFYGEETARKALEGARKIIKVIKDYYKKQDFEIDI